MSDNRKLRFMTYLSPGIPVELFETVMHYLENTTGHESHLIYESRWTGPPTDRTDPFTEDLADIVFMSNSSFLHQVNEKNSYMELCKAAPVHYHEKGENNPVYFADIIVKKGTSNTEYKDFHDLRGHSFAYNDPLSLSGCLIVLGEIKKLGFNSNYFGNTIKSGSHLNSIELVHNKTTDIAAIDSTVLHYFLKNNPQQREELSVIKSFGPMPIYPLVLNSRLPGELKQQITSSLLEMHKSSTWAEKLRQFDVSKFSPVDMDHYLKETDLMESVKNLTISNAYY